MFCCWIKLLTNYCWLLIGPLAAIIGLTLLLRVAVIVLKKLQRSSSSNKVIGIFHPYCNAGGGGERVLWAIVHYLEINHPELDVIIYTGDTDATSESIMKKMENNFCISLKRPPKFVFLTTRSWVEASRYPVFTLLGQSLGSLILAVEALFKFVPDIYLETMGYAFTYPLFKYVAGCKVGCYVHYPTISTDMIGSVSTTGAAFNNRAIISRSKTLTWLKLVYYRMFAAVYGTFGRTSDLILVNSSWTRDHINNLWRVPERTHRVYPPCNVTDFKALPLVRPPEAKFTIVSVAQFRPEKNHSLQIETMKIFLEKLNQDQKQNARLILVGSCRNDEDEKRVTDLRNLSVKYGIEKNVEFHLNFSFTRLLEVMKKANIGLHTMYNEHFGISVVENMASGLIMVANNSGGPQMDIIENQVDGFLASSAEEYAETLYDIVTKGDNELNQIREKARHSTSRFSDEAFKEALSTLFPSFLR
ncbi:GDP-Man:Man(3)GlcNAc(2)-PP-Dol alpha-1,2-mannosyltransferase [Halotydeus destructor]|nr:GDP-Man:Man(3)GlcNAc(2)-PP-Dol alpha-1,2-mannosyltransferase [Halotydeus destructor]